MISGFVISQYIYLKRETWSLKEFYIKRLWRLLPALYAVLTLIVIGALLAPKSLQSEILKPIPFATAALSNIFFHFNTSYFSNESILIPTLHTWSLAVEEQFYLIFAPIIAISITRGASFTYLSSTFLLAGLIAVTIGDNPNNWFYLLPSRAMELLAGCLAFFVQNKYRNFFPSYMTYLNFVSTISIISLIPFFHLLLPSSIVAATITTALTVSFLLLPGATSQLLFTRNIAFVALGEISYSLYLVHWPLISFAYIYDYSITTTASKLILIILSVSIASVLYYTIERKLYFNRKKTGLLPTPILAAVALILIVVPSIIQSPTTVSFSQIDYSQYFKENYSHRFTYGKFGTCFVSEVENHIYSSQKCLSPSTKKPNLLLMGDSHASYLSAGIRNNFPEFNIMQSTAVACPPLFGYEKGRLCKSLNTNHFEFASNNHIDIILVFANWLNYDLHALEKTLSTLKENNANIVLIAGVPKYKKHLARILFDSQSINDAENYANSLKPYQRNVNLLKQIQDLTKKTGVSFVSIPDLLCSDDKCEITDENFIPIFYDYGHLTEEGANYVTSKIRSAISHTISKQ